MEPVIVGGLSAATAVLFLAFFLLLVRPETLLSMWSDPRVDDGWFDHHPAALRALRYALGTLLFLSGFLTGVALTFLSGT
jgi:hypothetical protein